VQGVSHVVNFDVPTTPEAYTHRIGRTGRAEREGRALTFVTRDDAAWLRATERMLGEPIPRRSVEGFEDEPIGRTERPAEKRRPAASRRPTRARRDDAPRRPGARPASTSLRRSDERRGSTEGSRSRAHRPASRPADAPTGRGPRQAGRARRRRN